MAEIFDIRAERAKRAVPIGSYFVRVDQYETGVCGAVLLDDLDADQLRSVSENLFALARHVRDHVWQMTASDDDRQLSVTRVYGSSRVNCWTSEDIATVEQAEWLARRFDEAAEISTPTPSNRSEE